jgi:hypothetical protein
VNFVAVDIDTPEGLKELVELGLTFPPVVRLGDRWVHGLKLHEVARLLEIPGPDEVVLTPAQLYAKLDEILHATEENVRAFSPQNMHLTVPGRKNRPIRTLAHHVFAIPMELIAVREGDQFTQGNTPYPDAVRSPSELAVYGSSVRRALAVWFGEQTAATWQQVRTMTGELGGSQPLHRWFERVTWHAAQHARQLEAMCGLARFTPPIRLSPDLLEGLPLPNELW